LLSHVSCPDLLVCCTVSKAAFQRLLTASARHTRVLVQIIMAHVAWPPGRLAQGVDRGREQTAGRDRHWPNKTRRSIQALRPASCTALHSCTAQLSARAGASSCSELHRHSRRRPFFLFRLRSHHDTDTVGIGSQHGQGAREGSVDYKS